MGYAIAAAVIAAGGAVYSAESQKKAAGKNARNPGDLNKAPLGKYQSQIRKLLERQFKTQQYNAWQNEQAYQRQAAVQREQQLRGGKNVALLTPAIAKSERQSSTAQRAQDIADLEKFGGRLNLALANAIPGWSELGKGASNTPLLQSLNAQAMEAGPSALRASLESAAAGDLALGRGLSLEQEREAQQAARAGFTARGTGGGNSSVLAEILNRSQYGDAREASRRQFAAGVQGIGQAEDAANRGFALNVQEANQRARGMDASGTATRASTLLGLLTSRTPVQPGVVAATMTTTPSPVESAQIAAMGPSVNSAASALAPLLGYSQDALNFNANARISAANASANTYAAASGALMSSAGDIYAANQYKGNAGAAAR